MTKHIRACITLQLPATTPSHWVLAAGQPCSCCLTWQSLIDHQSALVSLISLTSLFLTMSGSGVLIRLVCHCLNWMPHYWRGARSSVCPYVWLYPLRPCCYSYNILIKYFSISGMFFIILEWTFSSVSPVCLHTSCIQPSSQEPDGPQ